MKTALVTGGTGFIGSHLVERLLASQNYDEVRCIVRGDHKWLEGLPVRIYKGDLFDVDTLALASRGVSHVYHVAGLTRSRNWGDFLEANIRATENLVNICSKNQKSLERILITSSLAAVGRSDHKIVDESSPLNPVSMYGKSKAMMEVSMKSWSKRAPLTIVRPPSVYGPRERDIFTFFKSIQQGLCPVVSNPDEKELSLVYVVDLVDGMIRAAESSISLGRTYFLGSDEIYSWRQVKTTSESILGSKAIMVRVPGIAVQAVGRISEWIGALSGSYPPLNAQKAEEIRFAVKACSIHAARKDLGYLPTVSLEEGLSKTIAWYRTEGWLKN